MSPHKHPNHREHEALGLSLPDADSGPESERRKKDCLALARLPEGRRIFAWLTAKDRAMGFRGNSGDAFQHGRRSVGEEFELYLKGILPRSLYIEIVYPEECNNGTT